MDARVLESSFGVNAPGVRGRNPSRGGRVSGVSRQPPMRANAVAAISARARSVIMSE